MTASRGQVKVEGRGLNGRSVRSARRSRRRFAWAEARAGASPSLPGRRRGGRIGSPAWVRCATRGAFTLALSSRPSPQRWGSSLQGRLATGETRVQSSALRPPSWGPTGGGHRAPGEAGGRPRAGGPGGHPRRCGRRCDAPPHRMGRDADCWGLWGDAPLKCGLSARRLGRPSRLKAEGALAFCCGAHSPQQVRDSRSWRRSHGVADDDDAEGVGWGRVWARPTGGDSLWTCPCFKSEGSV
jgi:hypothetical protein